MQIDPVTALHLRYDGPIPAHELEAAERESASRPPLSARQQARARLVRCEEMAAYQQDEALRCYRAAKLAKLMLRQYPDLMAPGGRETLRDVRRQSILRALSNRARRDSNRASVRVYEGELARLEGRAD